MSKRKETYDEMSERRIREDWENDYWNYMDRNSSGLNGD